MGLEIGTLAGAGFVVGFFSAVATSALLAEVVEDPAAVRARGADDDGAVGFAFVTEAVLFSAGLEVPEVGLVVPVVGLEDAGTGFLVCESVAGEDVLGFVGSDLRERLAFAAVFAELLGFAGGVAVAPLAAVGCFFIGDFAAGVAFADASVFVVSGFVAGLSVEGVLGFGAGDALAVGFVFCALREGFAVAAVFGVLAFCSGKVVCF